jgi:nitrogenase molybdenum-iron protein NifN
VRVLAEHFAAPGPARPAVNLLPGMLSAGDLRHLKDMLETFGLFYVLLPDYSETMDGETWAEYEKMPRGGTLLSDIALMGASRVTLEFGRTLQATRTAGVALEEKCGVPRRLMGTPIGLRETDRWLRTLAELTDGEIPEPLRRERGRLVDAFIDGHKYVFGRRALVYGEEDLVIGLASLLCEIGVFPVLCASGGRSGCFEKSLREAVPELPAEATVREGCDFATMAEMAGNLRPDFLLGSSKGYSLARQLNVPLVRAGFPIHDRLGGHRLLHVGYRGALELFDRIVNTLLEAKQASSNVGHSYL